MFSQYWSLMAWKTKQAPYWQPIQYLGWQLKFIFSCIGDSLVAILDFDMESFHFSLPDPWAHPNGFYIIYCEDCLVKAENYFMQKMLGLLFSVTIVWMKNRSPSTCTQIAVFLTICYPLSADVSGKIRIWDTTQKEHLLKYEYQPLSGAIKDIAWSPDSKRIAVAGEGREK